MFRQLLKKTKRIPYLLSERFTNTSDVTVDKITVNGVKLQYTKTGIGNHILLLLPGALGSAETDFGPQLAHFNKEKYTLIAFDPRGYGGSRPPDRDWPLNYFRRDAEDAAGLMKNLSYKKYSVIGWSDGGLTGLMLTAQYQAVVNKLVVWGSNAYITEEDFDIYRLDGIFDVDSWNPAVRDTFFQLYGEQYFRTQFTKWYYAYIRYQYNRKEETYNYLLNSVCPSLIIHGEKDPLIPREKVNYLHQHLANSRLHLMPKGKHNLHLRYYQEFNQLVEGFLDES